MKNLTFAIAVSLLLASCGAGLPKQQPTISEAQKAELLRIHNLERAKVGAPPLVWSDKLERQSHTWAKKLARKDRMIHKAGDLKTENLAYGTRMDASTATQMWLSEKSKYSGQAIGEGNVDFHQYGHYTQMIWADSREIGYGIASNGKHTYVVANYYPAGNYRGQKPTH